MKLVKTVLEKKIIREYLSYQIPTNTKKLWGLEKAGTCWKRMDSEAIPGGYRNLLYDKDDILGRLKQE